MPWHWKYSKFKLWADSYHLKSYKFRQPLLLRRIFERNQRHIWIIECYSRRSNLWAQNGGPVPGSSAFYLCSHGSWNTKQGTIIEIWHNEAITNSLPSRHVDKAGKTLQSTNLSACLCTNIIYVFNKCEIFVNTDAQGSDGFRKFDFLTLHWHTKFACLFVTFQQQTLKFSRVCFHSIIKEPLNRDFSFSLQLPA